MKFHNIGFQCLRNDAVTVLSDVCLSSGHRESLCISYMEFAQISGKRDQICHLYICSQLWLTEESATAIQTMPVQSGRELSFRQLLTKQRQQIGRQSTT